MTINRSKEKILLLFFLNFEPLLTLKRHDLTGFEIELLLVPPA